MGTGHAERFLRSVPDEEPIGIVLVDPYHVVREALGLLIDTQADLTVIAKAATAEEAVMMVDALPPRRATLALVGLELAGTRDAFWLIERLRERHASLTVVATSVEVDRLAVSRALAAGADGFVHKRSDPVEFLDALRRAAAGETVVTGIPGAGLGRATATDRLTPRERQVLELAAEGLTARQIGRRLELAERTVTTHFSRIYRKLGVSGRVAAIRAATRARLIETEGTER